MDCGNEGEMFVTSTPKTWDDGEEFCQTLGSHLVSPSQLTTACKTMLMGILGKENMIIHVSYRRFLDELDFRDVWNNFKVSDSAITIPYELDDCSSQYLGGNVKSWDSNCRLRLPIVCGRNTSKILIKKF